MVVKCKVNRTCINESNNPFREVAKKKTVIARDPHMTVE